MISGYAVADVRGAEDAARQGLAEGELMARAAAALAEVVTRRIAERRAGRVVVLVGPGDNGGDALWAAARLADDPMAAEIVVVVIAASPHPQGLAAVRAAGLRVLEVDPAAGTPPGAVAQALGTADLVVDGLLGIGGRPGLPAGMAAVVEALPERAYVLAVDLPSGADPAGEVPLGVSVRADETVTFGVAKPVHLLPATRPAVGRLTLVDIGVSLRRAPVVEQLEVADLAARWPVPGPGDHKYTRGVLAVVAGSESYPGAAVLCTTAAVEVGAGMVRYLGPARATDLVLASCPEAVPGPGQVQAAVLGPGVAPYGCDHPDCDDHQVEHVRELLAEELPLVLDAGALPVLAGWLRQGHRRAAPTLLTPHAGELAELLGMLGEGRPDRAEVEAEPVRHARAAARLTGCTVLLKGATTLVVDPDPQVPVRAQADGPAWLATAGAGDVLAGVAGVLLAAGLAPREAGSMAALVHGLAAHQANPGGPVRALAVARQLPRTLAAALVSR